MNSDADDAGIGKLRDALNSAYDAYVKDYGPINKDGNGFLEDDIEFPTVAAIERLVSVPVTKTYKSGKRKGESYQVNEKRVSRPTSSPSARYSLSRNRHPPKTFRTPSRSAVSSGRGSTSGISGISSA